MATKAPSKRKRAVTKRKSSPRKAAARKTAARRAVPAKPAFDLREHFAPGELIALASIGISVKEETITRRNADGKEFKLLSLRLRPVDPLARDAIRDTAFNEAMRRVGKFLRDANAGMATHVGYEIRLIRSGGLHASGMTVEMMAPEAWGPNVLAFRRRADEAAG